VFSPAVSRDKLDGDTNIDYTTITADPQRVRRTQRLTENTDLNIDELEDYSEIKN